MAIGWYLVVSALIFAIGAAGVLIRRNPLVILLCLELMLNAANLALVAFARLHGGEDGQVFALIVKSPVTTGACRLTPMPPVFEIVIFCAAVGVPTRELPKLRLVGDNTIFPAARPVPESEAVTCPVDTLPNTVRTP